MNSERITRTERVDSITYAMTLDGVEVSELVIDIATRKVVNVETLTAHRGCGYASALWTEANTESECFHASEHHRTSDGDAFARRVGGETIAPALDTVDGCWICDGLDEE